MKTLSLIILMALSQTGLAQPKQEAPPVSDRIQSPPQLRLERPVLGYGIGDENQTFSGIAVQMMRAPQPLQLINPLAPKAYGSGEQNLVFDASDRHPLGFKLFSIRF